jgi:hypothetical protein
MFGTRHSPLQNFPGDVLIPENVKLRGTAISGQRSMLPFDSKEFMKALPTWLRRDSPLLNCMNAAKQLALLVVLFSVQALGQARPGTASIKTPASEAQPWEYTLTVDGFIVPDGTSYVDPVLTADHRWLHLEARYNEESLRTASLWVGYNLSHGDVSAGDNWEFDITPMIGGVFGRLNGIAPGCEASLSYKKKVVLSIGNEYVFDTTSKSGNFYYAWPQLTYSPVQWLHVGAVAQHTAAYHTALNIQRGFLVGVSHKKLEFTAYVFGPGTASTTVVLETGVSF